MRIFAAPLIIFSPQVNLTTPVAAGPHQAALQTEGSKLDYTAHAARAVAW
jgi:hypothetical protein